MTCRKRTDTAPNSFIQCPPQGYRHSSHSVSPPELFRGESKCNLLTAQMPPSRSVRVIRAHGKRLRQPRMPRSYPSITMFSLSNLHAEPVFLDCRVMDGKPKSLVAPHGRLAGSVRHPVVTLSRGGEILPVLQPRKLPALQDRRQRARVEGGLYEKLYRIEK